MNFDLEDRLNTYVRNNDLNTAIQIAETELDKIPRTEFHQLIGMDLLHLESKLSSFISSFYTNVALKYTLSFSKKLHAFYCEMNGFTINYDRWFIDIFSFSKIGQGDYDWLADYDYHSRRDLTITGYEAIQKVFAEVHKTQSFDIPEIEKSYDVAELLIILRLQQLFERTYTVAKEKGKKWSTLPMYVTAHDYEMIYQIN